MSPRGRRVGACCQRMADKPLAAGLDGAAVELRTELGELPSLLCGRLIVSLGDLRIAEQFPQ